MFSFVSDHRRGRAGAAVAAATVLALTGCGNGAETGTQETQETGSQEQGNLWEGRLVPASSAEGHALREVPAEEAPSVQLKVTEDPWGTGWAVHVVTEDFEFAPETLGSCARRKGTRTCIWTGRRSTGSTARGTTCRPRRSLPGSTS